MDHVELLQIHVMYELQQIVIMLWAVELQERGIVNDTMEEQLHLVHIRMDTLDNVLIILEIIQYLNQQQILLIDVLVEHI